ncbi:hypothetical protein [Paenibacillus sp. J2TS4]|uniref:hypothetical protein n=1 Tax=Paenibacillus sp. J2TS4 TaxID=2807194 RepID=UPI001B0CD28B|nr:hypothetical protein [Paenibacillus sp. J2TS4]GIP34417.1 hypothetical protein J2TS4_36270 [Paenibacillus sp. J2TS4]
MGKKLMVSLFTVFLFVSTIIFSSWTYASNDLEQQEVEQVVHNYFRSLIEKDGNLYLASVANSISPDKQYFAKNLTNTDSNTEYEIVKIEKINNLNFEVHVSKTLDGEEYPIIPYDVVLENGEWKVDNSRIIIYPKDVLTREFNNLGIYLEKDSPFYDNVVSENESFLIKKISKHNEIGVQDFLTYNYGTPSVPIYSPNALGVESIPGSNDQPDNELNWVIAELYVVKDNDERVFYTSKTLDAFEKEYTVFSYIYGYHAVNVYNFNYPWLTGKYNVVW